MKKSNKINIFWIIILVFLPLFYAIHSVPSNNIPLLNYNNKNNNPANNILISSDPPNGIIYTNDSLILYNNYSIRLDGGNHLIENTLNISRNHLDGTPVLNSTVIENSQVLGDSYLININLYSNTKLVLRNIINTQLTILLFDKSELIIENCVINSIIALDSSKVTVKDSTINTITDTTATTATLAFSVLNPVSSNIEIFNDSYIETIICLMGSTCIINNSTISSMMVGGLSVGLGLVAFIQNTTEYVNQATITNSTIDDFTLAGISIAYIYGSNASHIIVKDLAYLTLNQSVVNDMDYGIVCNVGNTNITNGSPSGSYYGNSWIIDSTWGTLNLASVAVNNSASVNIKGSGGSSFELFLYDNAIVEMNDTPFTLSTIYISDTSQLTIRNSTLNSIITEHNSQLTLENSTVQNNFVILSDSSVTIQKNCTIGQNFGFMYILTTNSVSIDNSTINSIQISSSTSGSPIGDTTITNSTISTANVGGSAVVTFNNCTINNFNDGVVLYLGSILVNSTGASGSGSYTNYTNIISSTIYSRDIGTIEVNNSADITMKNFSLGINLILMHNANATLINSSILSLVMNDNTNAFISNSSVNTLASSDNSNFLVDLNSSIDVIFCSDSSNGNIINSSVTNFVEMYYSAKLTVYNSSILGYAMVKFSNLTEFSLRIYNSAVFALVGYNWQPFPIPLSNHPKDFITSIYGLESINWVLYDATGSGKYRVWANDTNDNYYIWLDWIDWVNNTNLQVPINRTSLGVFNYRIEFNNSEGQLGIPDTVKVTIRPPYPPPGAMIYGKDSIMYYNNYSIRIDGGQTIVENSLNLTEGKINGTELINSTKLEDSNVLANSSLVLINLFNNAKLNMSNIWAPGLSIYLFNNAELTVENCTFYAIMASDSSKVWIKNSSLYMVMDSEALVGGPPTTELVLEHISSTINILQDSNISNIYTFVGANTAVDNSTINTFAVGGLSILMGGMYNPTGFIEPPMQVSVKNSSINNFGLAGSSRATIFGSQINDVRSYGNANLTLNASTANNVNYGIICSAGFTNINSGVPSGNYYNNTQIINSPLPPVTLSNAIVNNSANLEINNLSPATTFYILSYDSATAEIRDSNPPVLSTIYVFAFGNSQITINNSKLYSVTTSDNSTVTIENTTIEGTGFGGLAAKSNSSVFIQKNSTINSMMLFTTNYILIDNSSINALNLATNTYGSPFGNVSIINTTITSASFLGSSVITLNNCTISFMNFGIIVFEGDLILDQFGVGGTASITNYTKIIDCSIVSSSLSSIEVNNSATINIKDLNVGFSIYLTDNAIATLDNINPMALSLSGSSYANIRNMSSYFMICNENSSFKINYNSSIDTIKCTDSSSGIMTNSSADSIELEDFASLTVRGSMAQTAKVSGANIKDYCLNIENSSILLVLGWIIEDLRPISDHPEDIITYANGSETIDWTLLDNYGESHYRVWLNDTNDNYYIWVDWTPWSNEVPLFVAINFSHPGIYNYTVEYNDSQGLFGIPDTVIVTIIDLIPTSTHPAPIVTSANGTEDIIWTLYDDFGPGQYRVWANDTNDYYYIWRDWVSWTNETSFAVTINRSDPGIYNYTIEYNDSHDQLGIPDTVIVTITDAIPTSTHPTPIITSANGTEEIIWTLYDDFGPGEFRVWVNDTNDNYYEWVGFSPWFNNTPIYVTINRSDPGIYNYTIEYYDNYVLYGTPDTVIVTITDAAPTSSNPPSISTSASGTENITWTLYDDFGPGQYRVWVNDTNDNYYIWRVWSTWINGSPFDVQINRSDPGTYNYTIEYFDNHNLYGISNSVRVTITDAQPTSTQPGPIITNTVSTENITWTLYDDFGPGQYRVWVNDTNDIYYILVNWTDWVNGSPFDVPIDHSALGVFNYTIEFYDNYNNYGISDTVIVTITGNNGIKQLLQVGINRIFLYDDNGFMWLNLTIYVNTATNITLTSSTSSPASFPDITNGIVYYNISLENPSALDNVTVRFHYNESNLKGFLEDDLVIFYYNTTSNLWEQLNGTLNTNLNYTEITLYNLSIFVLGSPTSAEEGLLLFPPAAADNFLIIIIIIGIVAAVAVIAIIAAKAKKGEKVEIIRPTFPEVEEKIKPKKEVKKEPKKEVKKEPKEEKIKVKRAYDYVGGNIRFKVVVENRSDEILRDISVLLNTREQFEIKSAVEKIILLDVNESRGLDFILTPMTCGKSTIYGTISFLDVKGQQFSTFMEPSVVQIKCPLVIPKIASSSDLKKLKEKLQYSHAEIKYTDLHISKAYQIAKDQISSLDVSEIEEHIDTYNVLYSGEAKVTGDQIIIDLNVKSDSIMIDVYVRDMKQSTGFLAYIKNLINLALQYSKDITTTLDKITIKIYNAFEFGQRLSELFNLCANKEPIEDLILLLKELKNKSFSYFPDLKITESFEKWLGDLNVIREKGEMIWDRTYLNLQYFILAWLESIIVFSETSTRNYLESPAVVEETLKKIQWGNAKLREELKNKTNQYSREILFALMIIHKLGGLSIYNQNFKGEELDSDLIGGFLTAIQSFGAEVSKKETVMKRLSYEHFEIELEEGEFVRPALITLGFPDELTIKRLNEFRIKFETKYRKDLEVFTHNVSIFEETKDLVEEIFLKDF